MPTDGTLFLENLPHSKQYLLTFLSIFFSLGAVLSSCISLLFLPGKSCSAYEGCDIPAGDNDGWKWVLLTLGIVVSSSGAGRVFTELSANQNLVCAFSRWFLFRLHESPRYLVAQGREQEAVVVLRSIAKFNDRNLNIEPVDVSGDGAERMSSDKQRSRPASRQESSPLPLYSSRLLRPAEADHARSTTPESGMSGSLYDSLVNGPAPPPRKHPIRAGSAFYSASVAGSPMASHDDNAFDASFARASRENGGDAMVEDSDEEVAKESSAARPLPRRGSASWSGSLLRWLDLARESWEDWRAQMAKLFVPQWRRTVILMWIIWGSMSLGWSLP